MTTGELTIILSWLSLLSGVAAIISAGAAWRSQHFARQTVREMQEAREPSVYLEIEYVEALAEIVVGNYGLSPALNVRFRVKDNAPWFPFYAEANDISASQVVKNGISFLGPGRTLRYSGGSFDWEKLTQENGAIQIEITFENEAKRTFTKRYEVNLIYMNGLRVNTFQNPLQNITEAINGINSGQTLMKQYFKKAPKPKPPRISCPVCAENILPAAKKCRYCHSIIPHAPPANGADTQNGQMVKAQEAE